MAEHYARVRRNRGAWLQGLLQDQARETGAELEELQEFDEALEQGGGVLVAVDSPAPARGYAALTLDRSESDDRPVAVARAHVLKGENDGVYRTLFSTLAVQAARLADRGGVMIILDPETTAQHVKDTAERLGAPYGVVVDHEQAKTLAAERDEQEETPADAMAQQLSETGGIEVTREAPDTSTGPHLHFEDRGAEDDEEESPFLTSIKQQLGVDDQDDEPLEDKFTCPECQKQFKSKQGLGAHSRVHSSDD